MGKWIHQVLVLLISLHYASPCIYFAASDISNQTLLIMRGNQKYCLLSKTTAIGDIVHCNDNATATKTNDTHVLLQTDEELEVNFTMEHGKGMQGEVAHSYYAACPPSEGDPEKLKKTTSLHRNRHLLFVPVIGLIILLLTTIWKKCKKTQNKEEVAGESLVDIEKNGNVKNGDVNKK